MRGGPLTLVALALVLATTAVSAPVNGEIKPTVLTTAEKRFFTAFEFDFGGTGDEKIQKANFIVDLGFQSILAGQKSAVGWGVTCAAENGCKIVSEEEKSYFFFNKQLFAKKAFTRVGSSVFGQLKTEHASLLPGKPRQDTQVEMVVRSDKWNHGDAGVLGLAPFGSFLSSLRNSYAENLSFLLYFKNIAKNPSILEFSERLFFNPDFPAPNLLVTVPLREGDQFWTVQADLKIDGHEDPEWGFENQRLCLSNYDGNLFLTFDRKARCNAIRRLICNGKDGPACTTREADFSKAPVLTFRIAGIDFEFKHTEYLYADKDRVVQCRFGNVERPRGAQLCHPEAEYAIGKLFIEKYPLIINFTRFERPSVSFLKRFRPPSRDGGLTPQKISIMIVGSIVLVAIIAFAFWKKIRSDSRDYPDYSPIEPLKAA